jgi:uncharacterized protein (TIGR03435 family)
MACFPVALQAQKPPKDAPWAYDVVSIKLEDPNPGSVGIRKLPTGFEAYTVTLKDLITNAYGLEDSSLVLGAPDWRTTYHVVAKLDSDKMAILKTLKPEEQTDRTRQMLQALLAEYFHLKVHHDTKPLAVYSLVVEKNGLKVKQVMPVGETGAADRNATSFVADGRFVGQCSMAQLAHFLDVGHIASDRPVIDETGIEGKYQFNLAWDTSYDSVKQEDDRDTVTYGSLGSALINEAGLRLVPRKIQADAIVVDHAEEPSLD